MASSMSAIWSLSVPSAPRRAVVVSVRAFGVFVRSAALPRDALVHASQVDEQITLDREDPDDAKIQALT